MAKEYRVGFVRRMVNRSVTAQIGKGKLDPDMFVLKTVGRKSGLARTTPVTIARHAGRRYLVPPYGRVGWVHNIRSAGSAELSRGGTVETIRVSEVDAATAGPVLKQYVGDNRIVRSFFDAGKDDPVDAFVAEASEHPVFLIEG